MKVSLMHHMAVMRSIVATVEGIRSAVYVDFWIYVQASYENVMLYHSYDSFLFLISCNPYILNNKYC